MARNKFQNHYRNLESPATVGFAITPSNTADLQAVTRAIYVGVGGNLKVNMYQGDDSSDNKTITLVAIPTGAMLPLSLTRVFDSDTTADSIIGFY